MKQTIWFEWTAAFWFGRTAAMLVLVAVVVDMSFVLRICPSTILGLSSGLGGKARHRAGCEGLSTHLLGVRGKKFVRIFENILNFMRILRILRILRIF